MTPTLPKGRSPRFETPTSLLPAIAQDAATGAILMLAWMNEEAFDRTRSTGKATFYSRSRSEIWEKGATSGHTMQVREIRIDCDGDALLLKVHPQGPACHTGEDTCWKEANTGPNDTGFLPQLERVVAERIREGAASSYTAKLVKQGAKAIAQKVGEEGVEVALEAMSGDDDRLIEESADLLYHLVVLLTSKDKSLADVERVLEKRHLGPRQR